MQEERLQDFGQLFCTRKTGDESAHTHGNLLPFGVLSFWQWAFSDLVSNTLRGVFAEYLVACDLGVGEDVRTEWNAYDLRTRSGVTVEVKSAAYLQSWHQEKISEIQWSIRPTCQWDAETNQLGTERKRHAQVYVFVLLIHQEKPKLDPLNMEQWEFYVLPTAVLDKKFRTQKVITFAALQRLHPNSAKFGHIAETIEQVMASSVCPIDHGE